MEKKDAKKLMCPFQQHPEKTMLCIADKCMAWDEEGWCQLIHGITGWLSRIAKRMPD